jgi:glycosyltransferase involved in cell wall biosynthesis
VFTGRLDDDALADQYAKCLAVFYAPIDEDMGYVPFEAFLAEKPVVTTRDAGGPLEVVEDRRTGLVCEPTPGAVAEALAWLRAHPDEARAQGQAGRGVAAQLTWDTTIDRLLGS